MGHGCFQAYLHKFKKTDFSKCRYCDSNNDDAEHTVFECDAWSAKRGRVSTLLNTDISADKIMYSMLRSKKNWEIVNDFINEVIQKKEEDERELQKTNNT